MTKGIGARALARRLERRRVTRSGATRIGVLLAAAAAIWFSRADHVGGILGSFFLALVLYCDVVRSHMRFHRLDALTLWSVSMAARLREYVVYVGLAFGAVAAGHSDAWAWAAGALISLALRDALSAARSAQPALSSVRPLPLPVQGRPGGPVGARAPRPRDGGIDGAGDTVGMSAVSSGAGAPGLVHGRADAPGSASSIRRLLTFGQPARFLVIASVTMVWDTRTAFVALIVGCVLAITHGLVDPDPRGVTR